MDIKGERERLELDRCRDWYV